MVRLLVFFACGLLWLVSPAHSEDGVAATRDVVSTLGLSRMADELGDGALLERLDSASARAETLVALRAAPFAYAPERLVPRLAALACGRDPALAPEAALAAFDIAERVRAGELAEREVLSSDLEQARAALSCRDQEPVPRADIVFALTVLEEALLPWLGAQKDEKD